MRSSSLHGNKSGKDKPADFSEEGGYINCLLSRALAKDLR